MEMWLAPALAMVRAMVSGLTRGFFSKYRFWKPSSSLDFPPTQEPVTMPERSRRPGVHSRPASRTASRAATTANCAKRSRKSASFNGK